MMEILDKILHIHDSYLAVFDNPDGRRVISHLCKKFHVTNPRFTIDPYETAFKEGQRHVVMSILKFINKDNAKLIEQIEEGMRED